MRDQEESNSQRQKVDGGGQGLRGGDGQLVFNGTEFHFCRVKELWLWMAGMVVVAGTTT